jgi:predicted Zn-dependent peptidase
VEPPQTGERRIVVKKQVANPYLAIAYHVPEAKHPDYYALNILSDILARGNSSRLYSALVDKKRLATSVSVSFGEAFDPTLFQINAVTNRGITTDSLEKGIYEELEKIKTQGITETELQKIKNQKLIEFYNQVQTINGKSNNIGTYEVFFGDYRKMFDAPAEYNKVTAEDIKRVAAQYLKKSNRTVGILQTNVD